MTGDGHKDIVRVNTLTTTANQNVVVLSNPTSGSGFWTSANSKQIYGGAPYGVSAGDLNGDGRMDVIISDDSNDRYGINAGNDGNTIAHL
jgi:hypothetical protein